MGTTHKGKLPLGQSFVHIEPENLVLTSIKKAEDSDVWVIQWYDALGAATDGVLTLPQEPKISFKQIFSEITGRLYRS